jgi:hypothetical protein
MIIRIPLRILKNYGDEAKSHHEQFRKALFRYFGPRAELIIQDYDVPTPKNGQYLPSVLQTAAYRTNKHDLKNFVSCRDYSLVFYIAEPFIRMVIQEKKIKDA